ncbi:DegT/DnrJ/EryC1/StrS family aminotransferase [Shewanella sp. CG12_big_fil_rev_8_21_14_0_65_47_15]|uniref:DegT/DnrJ/EryC1/StrS family aminotransferase n=1 Tax=Shewanella sp. CG12_big_fil_rev_8_21_14_0_65_47_15 TaxID=1975537 RepID=UPI000CC6AAE9|nr:DegT/DnrJ/EryC1/StrS family aminotransferase [Shewanella sp. CG12_big_fil_rev_8_21_14_0_65_47_15]PIW59859.1 MAG: UDP-4-amino-4,6-dideoxy-N-acetyl-beta-L-altrosamine transaminase [Shewanella sp. CG12_big_fil_rev_8_21_14_0_65_47_15]
MSRNFLPFALPEIGEEEINEVIDSLRSGWVTTGPKAKRFEEEFTAFLGLKGLESIAVNSATSGLHLALEAVGVGIGDEVIVPTYTFTATAEIVRYLGATPIMVDVDPTTFNMTSKSFEQAITERTKAVIPVHFAGLACEMDPIISVAKEYGIKVIEDAAHALPTLYNGKLIGTLSSDVTVFSFYANKTMTTGEGGMVVTADPEIAKRCKIMRLHGISRDAFDRYTSTKPAWSYEIVAPGYKYNMPDIAASIGIHQLKKLPAFQIKRQEMAYFYNDALKDLPIELPALPSERCSHAWHLYPIRLKAEANISRDLFIEKMSENGIGCSVHFIPLHLHPYWRDTYNLTPEMFPVAQGIFESEVSLPLYTKMTDDDLVRVVSAVKLVLSNG